MKTLLALLDGIVLASQTLLSLLWVGFTFGLLWEEWDYPNGFGAMQALYSILALIGVQAIIGLLYFLVTYKVREVISSALLD